MPALIDQLDVASPAPSPAVGTRRVLHLVNGEFFAGAERVQDLLALRLPEVGFDVGFACLKPGRFATARQSRVPLADVPMRSKWDLRPARELARQVRREDYELIHTHTPRSALVGRIAAWMAGVPLVHHIHSQTTTEIDRPWASRVNTWTERASLTGAAAVIAVSASAARFARRLGARPGKIHTVPNGIATRPLSTRPAPGSAWTIGTVALLRPRKGLETLLAAVARLRDQGFPARLRVVGPFETNEYRRQVEQFVAACHLDDVVDWTGFTRDVPAELDRMDLFVLPSLLAEGMPMVLLEAMSAGVPVIGSRVDGITDVIEHGRTGLLTSPGDAADLAEAIARIARSGVDWAALREAGHARQVERFSDVGMAAAVAAVYREVLDG